MTTMSWGTDLWVCCTQEALHAANSAAGTCACVRGLVCSGWTDQCRETVGRAVLYMGVVTNRAYNCSKRPNATLSLSC